MASAKEMQLFWEGKNDEEKFKSRFICGCGRQPSGAGTSLRACVCVLRVLMALYKPLLSFTGLQISETS